MGATQLAAIDLYTNTTITAVVLPSKYSTFTLQLLTNMRETLYAVLNRDILHYNISISICFIVLFNYNRILKVRFTHPVVRFMTTSKTGRVCLTISATVKFAYG